VGSANLDVVLNVAAIPRPGETVLATSLTRASGGKGANQAVAAARAGVRTAFLGAAGDDEAASVVRSVLAAAGADIRLVRTTSRPTGTAYVIVDRRGENSIVVDPGANAELVDLTDDERAAVAACQVLLCQLEIPVETVTQAMAEAGGLKVLNAAPAQELPARLRDLLDVLIVNEEEARAVAGGAGTTEEAVRVLTAQVPLVIVTRGAAGAVLAREGTAATVIPPSPARAVVDTTGAGDTFCGAFAAALATGEQVEAAAWRACVAAALSVERSGAAAAVPTREEVQARLAELAGSPRA
jgi:ribokinase